MNTLKYLLLFVSVGHISILFSVLYIFVYRPPDGIEYVRNYDAPFVVSINASNGCKFARPDPFDSTIQQFITHRRTLPQCGSQPQLAYIDPFGWLYLNDSAIQNVGQIICSYSMLDIEEGKSDDVVNVLDHAYFNSTTPVKLVTDSVEVYCERNGSTDGHNQVFHDVLAYPRNITHEGRSMTRKSDELSVLLVVFDSVSRGMFARNFPKSYAYMSNVMNFTTFQGHHKVADNTWPNLMAAFTGKRVLSEGPRMPRDLRIMPHQRHDNTHFIWKEYAKRGYVTSFVEDNPHLGLFHYHQGGFRHRPFNHYYRPYVKRIEKLMRNKTFKKFCTGNEASVVRQMELVKSQLKKYESGKHFSMFLHAELTHDDHDNTEIIDQPFFQLLTELFEQGSLSNTAVIVMSDHGCRDGAIRSTIIGLLEERLPIFSVYFPNWFTEKFPKLKQHLDFNSNMITSHFDIFETLLDIASLNFFGNQRSTKDRGQSLLYPISPDRTCIDAGVPSYYCTCYEIYKVNAANILVQNASRAIIAQINMQLSNDSSATSKCLRLSLNQTTSAYLFLNNQNVLSGNISPKKVDSMVDPPIKRYRISLKANGPSYGTFEASVLSNEPLGIFQVQGDISRLNKYRNQSYCIENTLLKKYCFCSESILNKV